MNYAIILAGGSGTRFWPLSREHEPKQFLNLCSDRSLFEETVHRISRIIKKENIFIATNKKYRKRIRGLVRRLRIPENNVLFEPQGKNTLAPIGLLSKHILEKDASAIILALPSDAFIKKESAFLKNLKQAGEIAHAGYIVTLGIPPAMPETGYGYIKVGRKLKLKAAKIKAFKAERFTEKPSIGLAKQLVKDKRYFWNAGIFVFRPQDLLVEMKRFSPLNYKLVSSIRDKKSLNANWPRLKSVSIDYGIMEKTKKAALVPAEFFWTDFGSWLAIDTYSRKDKSGNVLKGNCLNIGSRNIFAWSGKQLLVALGLKDIIIVNAKDALLVCAKERSQDVRQVVKLLKQKRLNRQI